VDHTESNLRPIAPVEFEKFAPKTECFSLVGVEGLRQWLSQSKGMAPIWPLLLMAALVVFAIEGILSNLVARRRSQGDEKQIATGRLNRRRMGVPFYGATAATEQENTP